jgi:hypothetical protein
MATPIKLFVSGQVVNSLFTLNGNSPAFLPPSPGTPPRVTNANIVGASAPFAPLLNFSNTHTYPDFEGGSNSFDTFISDIPYSGSIAAGTWTASWGILFGTLPTHTIDWHVRVRFYKIAVNNNVAGAFDNHGTLLGTGSYDGSIVTSRGDKIGYSLVSATLPQINLHNEYLCIQIGYVLDTTIAVAGNVYFSWIRDANSYLQTADFTNSISVNNPQCVLPISRAPERYIWFSPDGTEYPLDIPGLRFVTSAEGEGMPPINYNTQRGPFQHGVTLTDYFLQPRTVQLAIRHNFTNRDAYHAGRQGLVGILSPGLQLLTGGIQTGTLRKQLTDGSLRDLNALILQGPNFNPRGTQWDEFAYTEVLRFQAFDPIWYDPTVNTRAFAAQGTVLTYPITYPIVFSTIDSFVILNYTGTWKAYPTFTITGPTIGVLLQNDTTGDHIAVTYPLPAGRTMSISLQPGAKQILLDDGTSLLGYVTDDSDLSAWHLTPQNDGVNELRAYATGVSSASRVSMTWLDAYLGV